MALLYVRVRARPPCCVVSADVTTGTALSRGLVKVGRATPEREEKDGGQRQDRGSLQSRSAAPQRRAARNTRRRDVAEARSDAEGRPTFLEVGERLSLVPRRGGRGADVPREDLSTDGKRLVHLWPNALEIKKETKVGR